MDRQYTHPTSACDTKYSCQIPATKPPYPFVVPIGSLDELQATSGTRQSDPSGHMHETTLNAKPQAALGQCIDLVAWVTLQRCFLLLNEGKPKAAFEEQATAWPAAGG